MKTKWILLILMVAIGLGLTFSTTGAKDSSLKTVLAGAGKTYTGREDPEFIAYDKALRDYLAVRIQKKFGIAFDPKN